MTGPKKHILIVDDDATLGESLSEQLDRYEEFSTHLAASVSAAMARLKTLTPDLILLDAGLCGPDAGAALARLRRQAVNCPIILLTAPGGGAGPQSGANAILAKPLRFAGLLSLMRAQLTPAASGRQDSYPIGPYRFWPAARRLQHQQTGAALRLTEKEAAMLRYLHQAGAAGAGREQLLAEVWGYKAAISTHTLETHIYRLRRKIETDPAMARIVLTTPGGYRLAP